MQLFHVLIALESTDIYFVPLRYTLQSICAGEFSGYSNYSKPYGPGKQLINGLQCFFQAKKNHLCLAWEQFGDLELTLTYFVFNRNGSFILEAFHDLLREMRDHLFRLEPP